MRVLVASHPYQHLVLSVLDFSDSNIVLICSSIMTYDVDHLFICLPAIWIFFGQVSVPLLGLLFKLVVYFHNVEF